MARKDDTFWCAEELGLTNREAEELHLIGATDGLLGFTAIKRLGRTRVYRALEAKGFLEVAVNGRAWRLTAKGKAAAQQLDDDLEEQRRVFSDDD